MGSAELPDFGDDIEAWRREYRTAFAAALHNREKYTQCRAEFKSENARADARQREVT
jgi:hypothetical protein